MEGSMGHTRAEPDMTDDEFGTQETLVETADDDDWFEPQEEKFVAEEEPHFFRGAARAAEPVPAHSRAAEPVPVHSMGMEQLMEAVTRDTEVKNHITAATALLLPPLFSNSSSAAAADFVLHSCCSYCVNSVRNLSISNICS